ncbi:Holliday junction DNA helicase subunit RuvB [Synechococcus sp. PCC 7502]|uniref:Holliday junction branch migration DNA helicase RuvB n=1 Tax=Synechococcus sp. PCC 7502 TaxID=1173263 RepID=UPI00029F8462|nr:Holliday junction branch migration DNA helicase RuvB [Synechococcus sp. PCC 7502]AFY73353.1 Holliday junction DNA helicase subunit RuvB [Synechococcus sp. PCC 7502]
MAIISSRQNNSGTPEKPPKIKKTEANPSPKASELPSLLTAEATTAEKISESSESTASPEAKVEQTIRPQTLADYIGQKALKELLNIAIAAAKSRNAPLDHLLFYGSAGLGKTSLALIVAAEMGVQCKITSAPALERPRDVAGLLVALQPGDILFIDEIHRLPKVTEEILYSAMEDFRLDVTIGKGTSARIRSVSLNKFTLIGATTRIGALSAPLRDRFGFIQHLRFYEVDELTEIVTRTAKLLETVIDPEGATEIARRSRGTPRIANRLLKRVRDYTQVKATGEITGAIANDALELFNVDPRGLDWIDRKLLTMIIENFNGGPVGLETMAASTGEDTQTIEEVYEPYLLQIGYLNRTNRGRMVTPAAYRHLGFPAQTELL